MTDSNELSTYKLTGTRISPRRIEVDTGDAEFVVGKDVNPVEYFLGSIIGCLNSTGTMVARDMDIDIEEMTVELEGGVDYSRYRGEESDARPGLQDLDVTVSVVSDTDQATLDEWMAAIEERCPITDNVVNETPIDVAVEST